MTDRQRIEALLNRRKPDRVPVWSLAFGFSAVYAKASIHDVYTKPEVALAAQRKTSQDFSWVFLPFFGYAAQDGWEFGGDIKWPSGEFAQAPSVSRFPVETPEDAMNLKMPDIRSSGFVPMAMEFYKMSSQESLDNEPFNVMVAQIGPFSGASNIPGPEKFSKWLLKKPEAAQHLLRLATDYYIELMRYVKDIFGVDGVILFDAETTSANQIISPKQFEQFALPYIKEAHEKVLAMGYKRFLTHICGEQNLNLPYWGQVPMGDPGIVSFGHEVELETASKYFPNDIIMGNIEPAVIQTGTSEQIYERARACIEKGEKLPGGFILGAGCDIPPMADPDNVMQITKAANDFGWY